MYKGFVLAAAAAGSMSTHGPLLHVPLSPIHSGSVLSNQGKNAAKNDLKTTSPSCMCAKVEFTKQK